MEQLGDRVEQANMADVVKVIHNALTKVMLGWKFEGKVGDNCLKLIMTIPCSVKNHRPVEGKGYFSGLGESCSD